MRRVAIYIRVSTSKQDTDNQRRELEAVAKRSGWEVVKVYQDDCISGAKGRDKRPGLDTMMKAVNSKEFDIFLMALGAELGRIRLIRTDGLRDRALFEKEFHNALTDHSRGRHSAGIVGSRRLGTNRRRKRHRRWHGSKVRVRRDRADGHQGHKGRDGKSYEG